MTEHDKPQDKVPDKSKVSSLLDDHDPAISALYRQSAQELPPTALDTKILQAAHAAVTEPDTAPVPAKSSRQWQVLGGLAASVVVALLAVELLPHALRSPTPTPISTPMSKERAAPESARIDSQEQKAVSSPAIVNGQPMSAPAPVEHGLLQERAESNSASDRASTSADELARKTESEPSATTSQDSAAAFSGAASVPTETMQTESDVLAPESPAAEFNRIVALWEAGDTAEAVAQFADFMKRFPDFTPDAEHFELFKTLQAELDAPKQSPSSPEGTE